jgi:hypothetical protein
MSHLLYTNGIAEAALFRVEGELADNYNRCLEKIIGCRRWSAIF